MCTASLSLESRIRDQLTAVNELIRNQDEQLRLQLVEKNKRCEELAVQVAEKDSKLQVAKQRITEATSIVKEKDLQVQALGAQIQTLEEVAKEKSVLNRDSSSLLDQLESNRVDQAEWYSRIESTLSISDSRANEVAKILSEISQAVQARSGTEKDLSKIREWAGTELEKEKGKLREAEKALKGHELKKVELEADLNKTTAEKIRLSKELASLLASREDESATLERTRKSLVDAEQRIVNLKGKLKKPELKTQEVFEALKKWMASADGVRQAQAGFRSFDVQGLRDALLGLKSTLRSLPLDEVQTPSTPIEATDLDTVIVAVDGVDGRAPIATPPLNLSAEPGRKIVLKSPFTDHAVAAPPSVEQERVLRRKASNPASILKCDQTLHEKGVGNSRGRQAGGESTLMPRTRSMPPLRNHDRGKEDLSVYDEGDSQMEDLLASIRSELSLQQESGAVKGLKRGTPSISDERPLKIPRNSLGIFGKLEFEVGDLKSSYFPVPPGRSGVLAGRGEGDTVMMPNITKTKSLGRCNGGKITRKSNVKGRGKPIIKTYSKKPQQEEAGISKPC